MATWIDMPKWREYASKEGCPVCNQRSLLGDPEAVGIGIRRSDTGPRRRCHGPLTGTAGFRDRSVPELICAVRTRHEGCGYSNRLRGPHSVVPATPDNDRWGHQRSSGCSAELPRRRQCADQEVYAPVFGAQSGCSGSYSIGSICRPTTR